jgi:hypothetical protein
MGRKLTPEEIAAMGLPPTAPEGARAALDPKRMAGPLVTDAPMLDIPPDTITAGPKKAPHITEDLLGAAGGALGSRLGPGGAVLGYTAGRMGGRALTDPNFDLGEDSKQAGADMAGAAGAELVPVLGGPALKSLGNKASGPLRALLQRASQYLGGMSKGERLGSNPAAEGALSTSPEAMKELLTRSRGGTVAPTAEALASEYGKKAPLAAAAKSAGEAMPTFVRDAADVQSRVPPDLASRLPALDQTQMGELASAAKTHAGEMGAAASQATDHAAARARLTALESEHSALMAKHPDLAAQLGGATPTPEEAAAMGGVAAKEAGELAPIARAARAGQAAEPDLNAAFDAKANAAVPLNKAHAANVRAAIQKDSGRTITGQPREPDPALLQESFTNSHRTLPVATDPASFASGTAVARNANEMGALGEGAQNARVAQVRAATSGADPALPYDVMQVKAQALKDVASRLSGGMASERAKMAGLQSGAGIPDPAMRAAASHSLADDAGALKGRFDSAKGAIDAAEAGGADPTRDYARDAASLGTFANKYGAGPKDLAGGMSAPSVAAKGLMKSAASGLSGNGWTQAGRAGNEVGAEAYRHGAQDLLPDALKQQMSSTNNPMALRALLQWISAKDAEGEPHAR